jgi:hypothetical protein
MTPETFVEKLADLIPTVAALRQQGVAEDEAASLRASYRCVERPQPQPFPDHGDPLLSLLRRWEVRTVEVGMFRFLAAPRALDDRLQIGVFEVDPVTIDLASGEVLVEESGVPGHWLWHCTADTSTFLEALVRAAQYLEGRGSGGELWEDQRRARRVAEECATAAGGDRYLPFYLMMLGGE